MKITRTAIESGKRFVVVDELKGLAIFLVVAYHLLVGVLLVGNFFHGEVGVDIFLIVSGFLLVISNIETPAKKFLQDRFWRIYPAYWIAIVFFLFAEYAVSNIVWVKSTVISHLIGIHGFMLSTYPIDINQSWWFISAIVLCYLIFLAIRKRLNDTSLMIFICAALVGVMYVIYSSLGATGSTAIQGIAFRIPSFFIGLLAGQYLKTGEMEIKFDVLSVLGFGILGYLVLVSLFTLTLGFYQLIAVAYIGAWFFVRKVLPAKFLSFVAFLGLISYEIYLFHQPLIQNFNGDATGWGLAATIGFGLLLTCVATFLTRKITKNI